LAAALAATLALACQSTTHLNWPLATSTPTNTPRPVITRIPFADTPTPTRSPIFAPSTPTPAHVAVATPTPKPTPTPTLTPTATPTPTRPPAATATPTGSFRPAQCSASVDAAVRSAVAKYNLPRWFYYSIIDIESGCNPSNDDGAKGLAGLRDPWYSGEPYPMWLNSPDNSNQPYALAMNFQQHGNWIQMTRVSRLDSWQSPAQNLDRFSTGFAVPAFQLFKKVYALDDTEALRAVAFHWNKGMHAIYNPDADVYVARYDAHARQFRPAVEAQDGAWNGQPSLP